MRRKIEITTDDVPESTIMNEQLEDEISGAEADEQAAAPDATTADDTRPISDGAVAYITALQAELTEARAKTEDAEKRVLYQQAEFSNYRRRKEEQDKEMQKYTNGELVKSLLPVIDSFERALTAAEQSRNFDALVTGVAGTHKQIQALLLKAGVTSIETVGSEFDPKFHEAIGHTESDDYAPNTVAEEVQKGYMFHDRVLRPALVKVAQ